MRVLVDAHMIGSRETGNETYIANLLPHLAELPELSCGAAGSSASRSLLSWTGVDFVRLRSSGNWLRLLYALPAACRKWQADILHVTYVGPFVLLCPMIVSVHDVSFRRYAGFFSPRDRLLFATLLPLSLWRADGVITLSNHARNEILEGYPFLKNRVHVTPLAPARVFRLISDEVILNEVRARYGARSEFVLAVGNLQPRKNLVRLIEAFAAARQQLGPVQLLIVGKAQWKSSEVHAAVDRFGLQQDVVFTGYVPDEDLVALYNAARVFVYPSIYEGFGLPILEAMTCGTPVVSSATSSMPEVAGDAALLIDPYKAGDIAQGIAMIWSDPVLASTLSARGLVQSRRFSWHRTAQETEAVYRSVIAEHRERRRQ